MAGPAHDVLVQALRDDASLLPAILSRLRRVHLPPLLEPLDSAVRLARPVEVRPDLLHRTADGWVVCEVQLKIDWSKRRRWQLGLWLRRAVTAASVADVLAAAVKTTKPGPRPRLHVEQASRETKNPPRLLGKKAAWTKICHAVFG